MSEVLGEVPSPSRPLMEKGHQDKGSDSGDTFLHSRRE